MTKSVAKYTYEVAKDGSKVDALELKGSKGKAMTVSELRDFLNELVEAGYGDYDVEADTQDGESYSVRDEVLAFDLSKTVRIF